MSKSAFAIMYEIKVELVSFKYILHKPFSPFCASLNLIVLYLLARAGLRCRENFYDIMCEDELYENAKKKKKNIRDSVSSRNKLLGILLVV